MIPAILNEIKFTLKFFFQKNLIIFKTRLQACFRGYIKNKTKIYHFYGVTPEFLGLNSEKEYVASAINNHFWNWALNKFGIKFNINTEIHLFTKKNKRCIYISGNNKIVFHPLISFARKCNVKGNATERFLSKTSLDFIIYLISKRPNLFVFYSGISLSSLVNVFFILILRIPFIIHYHGGTLTSNLSYKKIVYKLALGVIVPTEKIKEQILFFYNVPSKKVFVIPCGINTEHYKPSGVKKNTYPTLCFSGIIEPRKSLLEALVCLKNIKEYYPEVKLIIAGRYMYNNYKEIVENYIKENNLFKNVSFEGWCNENKLSDIYCNSHLLLFLSRDEPLGRSLLESMSCETPGVALRSAKGPSTIISNYRNGILTGIDQATIDILDIIKNREKLNEIGKAARESVVSNFSFEHSYEKMEKIYLSLIK